MKINFDYKDLKKALQVLSKAKIDSDVLGTSYLCIDASAKDGVTISGVGEFMKIRVHLSAAVFTDGTATIRYCELKKFVDSFKGLKSYQDVDIEAEEGDSYVKGEVIVKVGNITQAFQGFDGVYEWRIGQAVSYQYVGGNDLVAKIAEATKFVDEKNLKPSIQGVAIDARDDIIKVVSTDTKALFIGETPKTSIDGFETFNGFISVRNGIWKLLEKIAAKEEVVVLFSVNEIYAGTADIEVTSICTNDNFPDYKSIVPKEFVCKTTISNSKKFADTLKIFDRRVRLNFKDIGDCGRIGINDADNPKSATAYVDNVLTGKFEVGIVKELEKYDTENCEYVYKESVGEPQDWVAVNRDHMVNALEILGDSTIELNGYDRPMHLQSLSNNDCVIVMPIIM